MRGSGTEPYGTPTGGDAAPGSELEGLPARRATLGARLRRVALVALVCVVAGAVLAREVGLTRPTRSALMLAPAGPVVLLSNVSYGTVTLNSQRVESAPPLVLPLIDGHNTIALTAPPFVPDTCWVDWGPHGWVNGNCDRQGVNQALSVTIKGLVVQPSAIITMRFSGKDLPTSAAALAHRALVTQLDAVHEIARPVPVGEPIAIGGHWPDLIASRAAGPAVRATMSFGLYDEESGLPYRVDCRFALCYGALFYTSVSASRANVWNVAPDAYYVWHFRDAAGDQVASLPYPVSPAVTVPLMYSDTLGWQSLTVGLNNGYPVPLDALLDGSFCNAGVLALHELTRALGILPTVVSNAGPEGCLITVQSRVIAGKWLWRFGVLLSADAGAQDVLPLLPRASAAEIAEVGG